MTRLIAPWEWLTVAVRDFDPMREFELFLAVGRLRFGFKGGSHYRPRRRLARLWIRRGAWFSPERAATWDAITYFQWVNLHD